MADMERKTADEREALKAANKELKQRLKQCEAALEKVRGDYETSEKQK
jgi:hypothetical protein